MFYIFSGTDQVLVREKAHALIARLEDTGLVPARLESEAYAEGAIRSLAGTSSLFGGEELIVLDSLSMADGAFEEIVEQAEMLAASKNIFVIIEGKIAADAAKILKKHAEDYFETKDGAKEFFNVFSLADALIRKDKKMLWVLLTRAYEQGLTPEEISGTLFWQLKSLRLARIAKSATEAGVKDFVFSKSKRALGNFKEGELEKLSRDLVTLYHEGHLGRDMNLALERWVLSV